MRTIQHVEGMEYIIFTIKYSACMLSRQ